MKYINTTNFEKVYKTLIKIFAEQEGVIVKTTIKVKERQVIQMKDLSDKQKYLLLKNALGFTGIVVTYVTLIANYFIK